MKIENKTSDLNDDCPILEASYADLYKTGFFTYKRAKLIVVWGKEISKNKQIVILKKLCPELKELSLSNIYDILVKNKEQWEFAEMGWGNAVDLVNEAQKLGLTIIVKETKLT